MSNEKLNAFGIPSYQYQISLPGFDFEGPLDLLLQLIERNELPVTEIALLQIAEEYVSYINRLNEVNPAELAEFLVIATRLLLIKSIALLPAPPSKAGEAGEAPNAAEELLAQLREYKLVKDAAARLRELQEEGQRAFASQRIGPSDLMVQQVNQALQALGGPVAGQSLGGMKLNDLLALVKRRLAAQQQQQLKAPQEAGPKELKALVRSVKIEDKILLLETRLAEAERVSQGNYSEPVEFTSLFDPAEPPSPVEVIVSFMAVLELVRRRQVTVRQDELFGEMQISRTDENEQQNIDEPA
jgi:segregation and condensation protein A